MVELRTSGFRAWEIHADTATIAALEAPEHGDVLVRVAPDEVMLIADEGSGSMFAWGGDRAVTVDATDGWHCWSLQGDEARAAFGMLSEVAMPEAGSTMCCEVAHIPARIVVGVERVDIFVASPYEAYLRERILTDCASLKPREVANA